MKLVRPILMSLALLALMLAISAYAWPRLGDRVIAVHFDFAGHPNGWAPKTRGLFAMPVTATPLIALFAILPALMPKNGRLERSWGAYETMWIATLTLLLLFHVGIVALALGAAVDMARVSMIGLGALLAVIGNVLGKVRYNYVFGVRTPWTLADERVWDRTHRFAGWIMTLGGLGAVVVGLFAPAGMEGVLQPITLALVLVPALTAVVYSYLVSRRLGRTP